MEDTELQRTWSTYDKKINDAHLLNTQSWALNLRCFETLQQDKARRKLASLTRHNIFAVILGIIWILFLAVLVWGNRFRNIYFSASVAAIALFSIYAVVVYIRHTAILNSIDYDGSLVETQEKLARLQTSTVRNTGIIWLQLPFYSTFFWSPGLISQPGFWYIAFPVTLALAALAVYLFLNLRVDRMDRKWIRSLMMAGPELKNVVRSMAFLKEVEQFKKDLIL